ncbi:helix-turn-helix domain-containing protein [Paenibacillus tianjinensis]|uniref:Helix-turn-helix transcriptional regulator n=1 Tax=Paenibacillus tianjinensis TaxID=2810347 RepID=A0ABX7L6S8_9BACL|nr:helix-turn-helix transcriptional regulator [Paenibacillus tianjinensis]QSF43476.1 helix-turn-helix transcriptional regulator [Paenibacillus tianjinensis]
MSWVEIKLQYILDSKGLTRRDLSRRTKIRPGTINEMCNNTAKQIPLSNIVSICDILDVDIVDLFVYHKDDFKKEEG